MSGLGFNTTLFYDKAAKEKKAQEKAEVEAKYAQKDKERQEQSIKDKKDANDRLKAEYINDSKILTRGQFNAKWDNPHSPYIDWTMGG